MPTYAYACKDCSHAFEIVQSFTDSSLTSCPECQGTLRKKFNSVGVVFKGSGFYRTDSRDAKGSTVSRPRLRPLPQLRRLPPLRQARNCLGAPAPFRFDACRAFVHIAQSPPARLPRECVVSGYVHPRQSRPVRRRPL